MQHETSWSIDTFRGQLQYDERVMSFLVVTDLHTGHIRDSCCRERWFSEKKTSRSDGPLLREDSRWVSEHTRIIAYTSLIYWPNWVIATFLERENKKSLTSKSTITESQNCGRWSGDDIVTGRILEFGIFSTGAWGSRCNSGSTWGFHRAKM